MRLHRYCEPLRHPKRPGLPLATCQLIHTAITAGTSRVAYGPLCRVKLPNNILIVHTFRLSEATGSYGL